MIAAKDKSKKYLEKENDHHEFITARAQGKNCRIMFQKLSTEIQFLLKKPLSTKNKDMLKSVKDNQTKKNRESIHLNSTRFGFVRKPKKEKAQESKVFSLDVSIQNAVGL